MAKRVQQLQKMKKVFLKGLLSLTLICSEKAISISYLFAFICLPSLLSQY